MSTLKALVMSAVLFLAMGMTAGCGKGIAKDELQETVGTMPPMASEPALSE